MATSTNSAGRELDASYSDSNGANFIVDTSPALYSYIVDVATQLTAAGSTTPVNCARYKNHTFAIVVANINTSVTVRAEGSLDGTYWFNLDDSDSDTTYTSNSAANTAYMMHKDNFKCAWVRFTFVSEVGGTGVTLNVTYMGGN